MEWIANRRVYGFRLPIHPDRRGKKAGRREDEEGGHKDCPILSPLWTPYSVWNRHKKKVSQLNHFNSSTFLYLYYIVSLSFLT